MSYIANECGSWLTYLINDLEGGIMHLSGERFHHEGATPGVSHLETEEGLWSKMNLAVHLSMILATLFPLPLECLIPLGE